jgi:hypothetical protein
MYDEVFDLVEAIQAEPALKVITFESANPDFFLARCGIGESTSRSANRAGVRRPSSATGGSTAPSPTPNWVSSSPGLCGASCRSTRRRCRREADLE